ncbi:thiamine pyrophosphate-dependent enzyme [Actinomadura madurae]|uniref:thiamine pyrophosphate-dependent enzyme n=1 Tax=Actinomadura madurae TaxID=1993 RepID=UPI0020D20720|nr:thiamine pyrophosphate-dependent enzyme [Actinomadura madurae]MCP9951093.1 thiamine pyrophosphate-dependent enzyme [Actinomadura madurae]MCP9967874.1 thiamine pyrophosphate-dependent enzyme [Actinomadura madurae]
MKRIEALRVLAELTDRHPVVVTCAATSRELASVKDGDNHLYLLDSMGLAGSVATGLALSLDPAFPKVVAIEGDGSLLMNPNVLPTGDTSPRTTSCSCCSTTACTGRPAPCRPTRPRSTSLGWPRRPGGRPARSTRPTG